MLNDVLSIPTSLPVRSNLAGAPDAKPSVQGIGPGAPASVPDVRSADGDALDRAIRAAAHAMYPGRQVEVTSFRDEASNRIVYRVADRDTGRVLVQSPPDALLRFYASARQAMAEPLVTLEA